MQAGKFRLYQSVNENLICRIFPSFVATSLLERTMLTVKGVGISLRAE